MRKHRTTTRSITAACAALGLFFCLGPPQVSQAAGYSLSSDGYVVHDGERLFPLGLFEVPESKFAEINANRFNSAARFWADSTDDQAFLQTLSVYGMRGIVGIDSSQVTTSLESVESFVENYVFTLKSGINPLAYLLPDEFLSRGHSYKRLALVHDAIKAVDPTALTIYDDFEPEAAVAAKDVYDIFSWDIYPIGPEGMTMEDWRAQLQDARAAASPKPFWLSLQAWANPPSWTAPTKAELRVMAYTAIANGANGIIAYAYDYGPYGTGLYDYPQLWNDLKSLMAELGSLSGILTLPDSSMSISTSVDTIDLRLKVGAGEYYLIAANYGTNPVMSNGHYPGVALPNVQFYIDGLDSAEVRALAGAPAGWSRTLSAGEFTDSLPAYGARVYVITPQ